MIKKIKKYSPDIIILIGTWILFYNILKPPEEIGGLPSLVYTDYHTEWNLFGVILITVGINIAIRRFISYKNKKKSKGRG